MNRLLFCINFALQDNRSDSVAQWIARRTSSGQRYSEAVGSSPTGVVVLTKYCQTKSNFLTLNEI